MLRIRLDPNGNAVGTSGADTITGNSKTNIIDGRAGNDVIRGAGGHDVIDGFSGNDTIYGDSGNDLMSGGLGRDTMTGGAGYDFFVFESKLSNSSIDTVMDFNLKYDMIMLWKGIFKVSASSNGVISSGAFWAGSKAHDRSDRILYDKSTGALAYDPDGTGSKAAQQFAILDKNLKMTYKDFVVF
ncbi:calcium-binding protein [Microvirga terrestris]|uniref:Calcium-binding protein n=1 Tax=Microvirga terrestris TaxID=2791024 RepID=A0ABS0HTA2_9HYPH|nr:calcium-binding protein [Microvirga terrestris]MBF9196714.1 calcium-binding protein [Microvirga terrestris]